MTEKTKTKVKKFRLCGKHLFLTYAQCELPREELLAQMRGVFEKNNKNKILNYVISTEKHVDEGEHLHAYLELENFCDIRDNRKLDLKKGEGVFHGNYQTCRNYENVQRYIVKTGLTNVLSNMKLTKQGKLMSA